MLDRNKVDMILANLEGYAREYAKAILEKQTVKEDTIEAVRHDLAHGLEVKELLDNMSAKLDDIEHTMKIMRECFYSAKDDLVKMVENIVLPNHW